MLWLDLITCYANHMERLGMVDLCYPISSVSMEDTGAQDSFLLFCRIMNVLRDFWEESVSPESLWNLVFSYIEFIVVLYVDSPSKLRAVLLSQHPQIHY